MVAPRRSSIRLNGARAISECMSLPVLPAIKRNGPPAAAFCMADSGEPMTTCRLPSSSGGTCDTLPRRCRVHRDPFRGEKTVLHRRP